MPTTNQRTPYDAMFWLPECEIFKPHFLKVVGDIKFVWHPASKDGLGQWLNHTVGANISNYIPIIPSVSFESVYDTGEVAVLFDSGEILLNGWSDYDPELDHAIDFAFADTTTGEFVAGIAASCGKDNNSRGTGFSIKFDCIEVAKAHQLKGVASKAIDELIEQTMMYYPFECIPNETCIEFKIASESGAHCAWKFYKLLKEKLFTKKTTVLLWEESAGYIKTHNDLILAILKADLM